MSPVLSYTDILEALKHASAFDLYRMRCAITVEMESPQKIEAIKSQLRKGQEVEFFDVQQNKCHRGKVFRLGNTNAHLMVGHSLYAVKYFMLNLDSSDTAINAEKNNKLTKNQLSTGDIVGFIFDGKEMHGRVVKLNPKTASIITTQRHPYHGNAWRVRYDQLFKIIDSEIIKTVDQIGVL